ncbi:MAG TPA: amino acid ABC transporter substrate-binding protein [Bradyrhizobium sp.]|jgi:branched-chain amino acid transport system substrate-binding protein|uniref:amino acid ABC transporter substrate-binding protein n=1 Tax=Bradyrhizobium sp. TaxID=376 RepID=UPI002CD6CCCF|nr:amino acid ABC transporter substrate-binding protein [Bradyrhizobium sp.]HTB03936.1 amino acid ABC transporter substrate-binding protein [Bradyrhizobium sp.]
MTKRLLLAAATALAALTLPLAAHAADPVRIGVALSQTGNLADSAAPYFRGLDLWREQANARGGLAGRPVEFVVYDDRSDPATAARLYEKLITGDKVDFVISSLGSATAATGSAVAEKHKMLMINGGGAAEAIQQRGFKYVFQTAARISSYADGVIPMVEKYHVKSIALVSRDYAAARDISKAIKESLNGRDVKVVMDEYFPAGTADFSSQIAKGQQLQPDLWIGLLYPSEAIETVRQFHSMNYMPKLFIANGVSQQDFIAAAGQDAEYALGMSLYEPSLPSEGNKEFVKTYREKYNGDPGYYAAFGFVAGTVLEAAVKQAGSIDIEKVRDVLTTLKMGTVMGKHEVDPATYMQIGVRGLLVQIQNGKREVIWPEEFKTAEPKLPIPAWDKR